MENQNTQTNPQNQPQTNPNPQSKGKNTGMAAVAYIIFFIPLLTDAKNSPFVKYHVKQGLALFIFYIAVWFIVRFIPVIGWMLAPWLDLAILVFAIIGIINALNGEEKELPIIGSFAKNFKF